MDKPFKTYDTLIRSLRKRNMSINNGSEAKRILERENYYSVINGYKDLFLDRDSLGNLYTPERYKNGTSFKEVYYLFELDRKLRNLILPEIIKFESTMKAKVGHFFHKEYPEKNSFLDFGNYTQKTSKASEVLKTIATLSNSISRQKNNPVSHYIKNYQHVPLWVLVNYLTFGNISRLYNVCSDRVRLNIAKEISKNYVREYNLRGKQVSPEMLDEVLGSMVMFRNVCAHDERLFTYKSKLKAVALEKLLNKSNIRNGDLFSTIVLLKLFLKKSDYKKLLKSLQDLMNDYSNKFTTIKIDEIKNIIGYDKHWIKTIK